MTGELSKNFHGVGIGPLSKILAIKTLPDVQFIFLAGMISQNKPYKFLNKSYETHLVKPQKCALPLPLLYLSLLLLRWKLWTRRGTIQTAEILTIVSSKREEWSFLSALLFWDSKNFLLSDPTTGLTQDGILRWSLNRNWHMTCLCGGKQCRHYFKLLLFLLGSTCTWVPVNLNLKIPHSTLMFLL